MNCPSCGAPMRLKPDMVSFRCDYCQSVYLPETGDDGVRVLGEPTDLACPICNIALVHAAIAKVRIVYCTGCHGMLIPMEVLPSLIDELQEPDGPIQVQPALDSQDLLRKINCPRCHKRMDTHPYAGPGNVVIDSCEPCSLNWFDRGELMHIVHAPDNRNLTSTEWE